VVTVHTRTVVVTVTAMELGSAAQVLPTGMCFWEVQGAVEAGGDHDFVVVVVVVVVVDRHNYEEEPRSSSRRSYPL
jgi:hypothetical protein